MHWIMIFLITSCSAAPKKDFKSTLWQISDDACLKRLNDNDEIEFFCLKDVPDHDYIALKLTDHVKELDFQSLQKRLCKEWKTKNTED